MKYIVIGSNNFWYAQCGTKIEAVNEAKAVLEGEGGYSDPESGHEPNRPDEVHIFKAEEVERFTLTDENRVVSTL